MRVLELWCFVLLGLTLGCAQPPTHEIDIAAARIQMAQREGAAEYAEELLLEAENALAHARELLGDPNNYREAVRAAATASLRADAARGRAIEEKNKIAGSASRCLREIRALLEESKSLGAERIAPNALATYVIHADTVQSTLDAGNVADAFTASEALKQDLLVWLKELETSR